MKASERMKIQRQVMPESPPDERSHHFREVNLGLPPDLAAIESKRCLACKNHECVAGCPVGIDIPGFIAAVDEGDLERAANILYAANVLPGITGRVCPQETQCEELCLVGKKGKPVAIGYLERYVADWARDNLKRAIQIPPSTGKRVAVVGSGPAGLTCAGELAKLGHQVTVFEALHRPGGVLVYGIPEFRLPKAIVDQEVKSLEAMGVKIECNVVVGATMTLDDLMKAEGFHAVFVGNGAGLPVFQNIPGENLKGVYSANEYLTRVNLMSAYLGMESDTPVLRGNAVVVVGGGNTAMDGIRRRRCRRGSRKFTTPRKKACASRC
jgi:glutamate synthase (NADPH/NADH) small chain